MLSTTANHPTGSTQCANPLVLHYLINGDAPGAEKVFREDLDRNPRNPRSLFGLHEALKTQGRDYDAGFVQKQFQGAWKGGATPLKVKDLV